MFSYGVNRYYADRQYKGFTNILENLNIKQEFSHYPLLVIYKIMRYLYRSLLPEAFRMKITVPFPSKLHCERLCKKLNFNLKINRGRWK